MLATTLKYTDQNKSSTSGVSRRSGGIHVLNSLVAQPPLLLKHKRTLHTTVLKVTMLRTPAARGAHLVHTFGRSSRGESHIAQRTDGVRAKQHFYCIKKTLHK